MPYRRVVSRMGELSAEKNKPNPAKKRLKCRLQRIRKSHLESFTSRDAYAERIVTRNQMLNGKDISRFEEGGERRRISGDYLRARLTEGSAYTRYKLWGNANTNSRRISFKIQNKTNLDMTVGESTAFRERESFSHRHVELVGNMRVF